MDAAAWDQRYAASPRVWSEGPNQFVARETGDLAPGRALDLACGEGRNAIWLARRGWQVTALDFSAVAVARGAELEPGVTWQVGDVLDAPLPEALDLVLLSYLQLSATERRTALQRAWASLRPGGRLLVVAHDATNLTEGTGGPQDPDVLYTAQDVVADLGAEPAQVVRAERVARTVHVGEDHRGEEERTAWDALAVIDRAD